MDSDYSIKVHYPNRTVLYLCGAAPNKMMQILLCAIFLLWTQCSSIPLDLIPEDDKCADVACPELNCTNTIKKEGECCMSCITIGRLDDNIHLITLCYMHACTYKCYSCKLL